MIWDDLIGKSEISLFPQREIVSEMRFKNQTKLFAIYKSIRWW